MRADGSGVSISRRGIYPAGLRTGPNRVRRPDGIHCSTGHDVLLFPIPMGNVTGPIAWSPDGSKIAFSRFAGQTDYGIAVARPTAGADHPGPVRPQDGLVLLVADRRPDHLQDQRPLRQPRRRRPVRDERRRQRPNAASPRQPRSGGHDSGGRYCLVAGRDDDPLQQHHRYRHEPAVHDPRRRRLGDAAPGDSPRTTS